MVNPMNQVEGLARRDEPRPPGNSANERLIMPQSISRRGFLGRAAGLAGATGLLGLTTRAADPLYKISIAEWSFHKAIFSKKMDHLDFPKVARKEYGIEAVELVNQFFKDKANDAKYLAEYMKRAHDHGVKTLLIMIDGEGALGDPDKAGRAKAVENHFKWVEAAKILGCHSIRVNAETQGKGSFTEQQQRAAEGLGALSDFAAKHGLNVIVENHGHLSSHGAWLAGVMQMVKKPNCGTLPDFGNFNIGDGETYDRYKGVAEMMPFAKAVSAKSNDFDKDGNEIHTDYRKMMKIVVEAGYKGHVGIEYEGEKHSEADGVRLTRDLLLKVRDELAKA